VRELRLPAHLAEDEITGITEVEGLVKARLVRITSLALNLFLRW